MTLVVVLYAMFGQAYSAELAACIAYASFRLLCWSWETLCLGV